MKKKKINLDFFEKIVLVLVICCVIFIIVCLFNKPEKMYEGAPKGDNSSYGTYIGNYKEEYVESN